LKSWKQGSLAVMAAGKVYSFEEVRKHSAAQDCWLIISGKVVSISLFQLK
jgi:cytochrome b involved in lipid metabolism